ncbi:SDR family NAD(P)-dependent oxidoreductase [Atopococcus tabaci]|uniref:SDR family NAD(P)-dependent oxidoreductase n=1 Tax=Atopococcus tabaci TaxID=269774 RepID=UPI00240A3CE3|nr:SDR family oxidoreductase [Atopococcus tabaci]
MDLGIKGKIALITGADSGIGLATARMLLEEGATVVLNDKTTDELQKAAESLGNDERVLHYSADITDPDALQEMHEKIKESAGTIDILVQNAGTTGETGLFHELSDEGWVQTLEEDLLGPVRVVKEFLPDLREKGWGRIVFVSSENGVQPYEDELPYDCSKAGILALSKGLSRTYAKEGVLINTVSPAFIETPMTDKMMEERAEELGVSVDEAIQSFLKEERPFIELGRRGKPEEVAAVIAWLCSDKASFINGSNYRVDGGSVATI